MDIYTKDAITNKLTKKQDKLVSGTNIKKINGNSILGSGNLTISGGGSLYQHNLEIRISSAPLYITIFNNSATKLSLADKDQVFNAIKPNMTGAYCLHEGPETSVYAFYVSGVVANTSFDIRYGTTRTQTITKSLITNITDSVS